MKVFRKNVVLFGVFALLVLVTTAIYNFTIYNKDVSMGSINTATFILSIVLFMIFGLMVGRMAGKNGLRNGLLYGLGVVVILALFSFLGNDKFQLRQVLRYLILLLSSGFGGTIGVNIPQKK
jgi:putative membrane protein (TIGR04086 family)